MVSSFTGYPPTEREEETRLTNRDENSIGSEGGRVNFFFIAANAREDRSRIVTEVGTRVYCEILLNSLVSILWMGIENSCAY